MNDELELRVHRLLHELDARTAETEDLQRALRAYTREARRFFAARFACVAVLEAGGGARVLHEVPRQHDWDLGLFARFLRDQRTTPGPDLLVAPVRRRGRLWAVAALARPGAPFARGEGKALARVTRALSRRIAAIEQERAREVRERIDRKIMGELRAKDLFYQILHGLRSLTEYDHSSAILIGAEGRLEIVAEQAAWTKTKSRRVGRRVPVGTRATAVLASGEVCGFDRAADGWRAWDGRGEPALARELDYHGDETDATGAVEPRAGSMLCAPLLTRDGVLGVLKVASLHPGSLGGFEADLLRRFEPHASIAIRNLLETESMRRDVLRAERRHAMVSIARGISHDVNNALGAVLPVVQQMRADAAEGALDAGTMQRDLCRIETAVRACQRVFRGLLRFARAQGHGVGQGDVRRAVHNALEILQGSLDRQRVRVEARMPEAVPAVRAVQHELEQLFLNLCSNARDAMPQGGTLAIEVTPRDAAVAVLLSDDGVGMTRAQLARAEEAFYTTKPSGNGLGLSVCRSIVTDMRGQMAIESRRGAGTAVRLELPRQPSALSASGREEHA